MGLDMYLTKKTYVKNWSHYSDKEKFSVSVKRGGKPFKQIYKDRISYILEEFGYWRKANAIHRWIVENVANGVDDCKPVYFPAEKMQELLEKVNQVLGDLGLAKELLPPGSGFFFGSEEIDGGYIDDLKITKEILESALKETDVGDFYYEASW